jgi:hypothetical protein
MSKNELRVIARIVLIGVGLYVLLQTVLGILTGILMILTVASADVKNTMIITSFAVYVMLAVAAVYFLARIADRFSTKIVAPEPADDSQISWIAAAFRLVCVTVGILFLYWTAYSSIATLVFYISVKSSQYSPTFKGEIVKCAVMLGLGIYLACGAPGFVRWQVKKTLEQCRKIDITP